MHTVCTPDSVARTEETRPQRASTTASPRHTVIRVSSSRKVRNVVSDTRGALHERCSPSASMCMHKRAYTHSKRRRARERYKKQANPRSHTPNATLAKGYPSHSELVVEVALAHLLQLIPQQGGSGLVRSQRLKRGGWGVVLERPASPGGFCASTRLDKGCVPV